MSPIGRASRAQLARASGIEAEAEAVERAQPRVAPAAAVLAVERPAGRLDPEEAERLGRERQRLVAHEGGRGGDAATAVDEVEHHRGAEPGRGHAEPGVAEGV